MARNAARNQSPAVAAIFNRRPAAALVGSVNGQRVLVGKPAIPARARRSRSRRSSKREPPELQEQGRTVIFVAVDDRAAGIIAVADPIKESTPGAIERLHSSA